MSISVLHRLKVISAHVPAHSGIFPSHTFPEKNIICQADVCLTKIKSLFDDNM